MQMVKLVFSDSLKCALSRDIYHNLIFRRRHVENLTRKKTSKTDNLFIAHHMKVIHAKKQSNTNRTTTQNFKRF